MKNNLAGFLVFLVAIAHTIWMARRNAPPSHNRQSKRSHLNIGDISVINAPTQRQLITAFESLSNVGGPEFIILTRPNGDYMQTAPGRDRRFDLEARLHRDGVARHYRANSLTSENLSAEDARDALLAFFVNRRLTKALNWVNVTDEY